ARWRQALDDATEGVEDLEARLRSRNDPDADAAAEVVGQLAAGFPDGLSDALTELTHPASGGPVAPLRARVRAAAKDSLQYLTANKQLIGICERNLFGAPVEVSKPLAAVLASIVAELK